jgi:hypothetical protein
LWASGNQTDSIATGLCGGKQVVTISDRSGCSIVDTVDIAFATGIVYNTEIHPVIYPNPTTGKLFYHMNGGSVDIMVFNILGEQRYSYHALKENGELDLSALSSGVYFIRFTKGGQKYTQRIIKE